MSQDKFPHDVDIEKEAPRSGSSTVEGAVPGDSFEYGNTMYAKLQRIAGKLHVEQRGIERVPEDERDDNSLLNVGTMVRRFTSPVYSDSNNRNALRMR